MSAAASSAFSALRSSNFALFWVAQLVSGFGDPITIVALTAVTYRLTGSAFLTALAVVVATVPYALFGFFAGAIADALGHRRAMLACDVARVPLIAAIPLALAAGAPLAVPYVLALASALCGSIFNAARVAIVPALVARDQLTASNSLVVGSDRSVDILGYLAAGVLVAAVGEAAFYVDALTFAVSAVLLGRIAIDEPVLHALTWSRLKREAADGIDFIRRDAVMRSNTVFSLVAQLALPVYNSLVPVLVFRSFADGDTRVGATLFGTAQAFLSSGAVAGAVLLPRYLSRFRKGRVVIVGFAGFGLALLLVAAAPTFPLLLAAVAIGGVMNVVFLVPNVTIAQEITPPELRGRVFGARASLLHLTWLPMIAAAGALADAVSVQLLIGIAGALTLATALMGSRFRILRDVP